MTFNPLILFSISCF